MKGSWDVEQFGPYRLLALLGRGGMGEVWRALDTRKEREVALKVLGGWLGADPGFATRFRREASLAARLNAPHILPIHDYGEIGGRYFIDMPLIEGTDLDALVAREGPLSPARAVAIVGQVADALDAAHDADLLHRDVKPSNVLVVGRRGRSDFAYLIDFGIARAASGTRITTTGRELGTLAYMAPERMGGDSDHRADIYALACLLHTLLTGQPPFVAPEGAHELGFYVNAHLNIPPPRASELSPEVPQSLDEVIAQGMAKHPSDRPDSAGAFASAASAALVMIPAAGPADESPAAADTAPTAVDAVPTSADAAPAAVDAAHALVDTVPEPVDIAPALVDTTLAAEMTRDDAAKVPVAEFSEPPSADAAPRRRGRTVRLASVLAALMVASVIVYVATRQEPSTQGSAPTTAAPIASAAPTKAPTTIPALAVGADITVKTGALDSIAATPDGRTAWASEPDLQGSGTFLHQIDTSTWTTTGTYPLPDRALDLAVAPDGSRVYLTGQGEGVLQVFDVATHQVVAKVPVGADPTSAAVSADGRFAYTSGGPTGDHIQIVDTATNKVAADLDVGAAVNEMVVRGDSLIVGTGKGVALLDAATGQRRGEVDATGYLGAVSPDGRTAYLFTDRAGQFVKLDLSGLRIVNTVQLNGLETPVGFSADGASAYFRVESPLSIAVVDVGTNRVTRSVALPAAVSNAAAVSPDGRLVYFRGPGLATVVVVRVV